MIEMERIVLGTRCFNEINEMEIFQILEDFFSLGGRYIDTAFLYGDGWPLKLIGKFNKLYRPNDSYISKIGYFHKTKDYRDINNLRKAIDKSCNALNMKPEFILLHEADWLVWWASEAKIGELINIKLSNNLLLSYFDNFRGLLKNFNINAGISGNNAHILGFLFPILRPKLVLLSKQYDLLWKNAEPLITSVCDDVYLLLGAPFHQGWLFKLNELKKIIPCYYKQICKLEKIALQTKYALDHIALNFMWQSVGKAKVVFGVKSAQELRKNLTLISQNLPEELN